MNRILHNLMRGSYLRKWLVPGTLIGIVDGVGSIAFITFLELGTKLLLEGLGGYAPALPIGEGNTPGDGGFDRPWAIPLVVGLGGLMSGVSTWWSEAVSPGWTGCSRR